MLAPRDKFCARCGLKITDEPLSFGSLHYHRQCRPKPELVPDEPQPQLIPRRGTFGKLDPRVIPDLEGRLSMINDPTPILVK